ncbi:MAG: TetR/AcrR family transcriptional regulator [Sedimentisphaerales bacterium]|nr:TetR/AcrR family transcriptional regulator [Sedimentisphaerales bacterium]
MEPGTTKSRILEAAQTLLSAHGYESTTIDDIITAAGVTKGAFYHYFKSKEHLCEVIIEQTHAAYQTLVASLPADAPPIERLRAILEKLGSLNASGQWVHCRLILRLLAEPHAESSNIQHALAAFWQWYKGFYLDLIAQCRRAGQLSNRNDPQQQTQFFLAMLAGMCLMSQFDPATPPLAESIDQIINAL